MNSPGRTLRLAPSLLSADFAALGAAVQEAERGGADAFHLDVMDGHFVPNISFGPALVRAVRAHTRLPLDVHLMIDHPVRYADPFVAAGGSTLVFHLEAKDDPAAMIAKTHDLGASVGVAVKPDTPVATAEPWLDRVEQLLVMSVHPGFSGQSFLLGALPKLAEARRRLDALGSAADISIDGGVTADTAGPAAEQGATFFVCGNSVFVGGNIVDNLHTLRRSVEGGAARAVR